MTPPHRTTPPPNHPTTHCRNDDGAIKAKRLIKTLDGWQLRLD